ncbi:MAG: DUF192 domain-containing protein [Puniceicoccales bacterium]|jgi:uncharacterized membrane protein (UPF0127 family)|nr:DUF192 domain-containing protein [Puniceicoccales bacterium]
MLQAYYRLFLFAAVFVVGCKPSSEKTYADAHAPVATVTFEHRFPIQFGGKEIHVQLALTELEKARGLMGRTSLQENEGMFFVFPSNQERSFWMRDVPINISLGYLTEDGKLDEIKALYANDPSSVPSRSREIRYVLEMPEGWFEKAGIKPGAQIDIEAVRAGITARGFKPGSFLPEKR